MGKEVSRQKQKSQAKLDVGFSATKRGGFNTCQLDSGSTSDVRIRSGISHAGHLVRSDPDLAEAILNPLFY